MKTLKPVDEETYARIGKAYQICTEYPEVFGDVTMKKFCSMFVDVVDEDENEREARMKVHASEMYRILKGVNDWYQGKGYLHEGLANDIWELLKVIEGGEASDE